MASAHILFDNASQFGAMLRDALRNAERSDEQLTNVRDVMVQMRDGDGTANAHYAIVVKRFKFAEWEPTQGAPSDPQCAVARAAFEEIDALWQKMNTNASVTNVKSARRSMFDKMRG